MPPDSVSTRGAVAEALFPADEPGAGVHSFPDAAVEPFVLRLVDEARTGTLAERGRPAPAWLVGLRPALLTGAVDRLVALGWEERPRSGPAGETVTALARWSGEGEGGDRGEGDDPAPHPVAEHTDRLVAAVERGVGVASAVETLAALPEEEGSAPLAAVRDPLADAVRGRGEAAVVDLLPALAAVAADGPVVHETLTQPQL